MKILVLGGYGEMGRIIVIDLFETFRGEIIVAGRDKEKAKQFANSFKSKNVKWVQANINQFDKLTRILEDCDVVINATQYNMNLKVMAAALRAKVNYIDLGGLFHMTKKQLTLDKKFKKAGITAIVGCGATPGITNVLAAHGVKFFDRVSSIHVQFADKDYTKYNMPFVVPYSMHTIFDEFSMKPAVFKNRKSKFVKPVSGLEEINFPQPINKAVCFYTLHSEVATFPYSFKVKGIKNCSFKGGFEKGFVEKVKFLIDTGFVSETPTHYNNCTIVPRDFTVKILNKFIPENIKVNDIEFLRVEIIGNKSGKNKRLTFYCKSISNKKWNIPAGSWDTGTPPSIIAQMLINGYITKKGVLPPELCINPEVFFKELAKRQIQVFIQHGRKKHSVTY